MQGGGGFSISFHILLPPRRFAGTHSFIKKGTTQADIKQKSSNIKSRRIK